MSISTNVDPIEEKAVAVIQRALPERIITAEEYIAIAEDFKATNALLKEIAEHHDPIIASANKTHKLALAAKAKLEDPLLKRKTTQARLLGDYQAEQKRIAAEEERKKREAAMQLERARLEREAAEARRIATEKAAEEERLRNDAKAGRELAAEAFEDYDGPAAELLQAEAESNEQAALRAAQESAEAARAAHEIATAPVNVPAVRVAAATPQVDKLSGRTTWFAEVVNKRRYLEHVLANFNKLENTIEIDMSSLNRMATSVKKEIEIEPGVMARPRHSAVAKS